MGKKTMLFGLVFALLLALCGCSSEDGAIPVQRVDQLALAGWAGERYPGIVVSENVVEINRDSSKRVEELYVAVGQEVKAGDKLFSYDSDELELALEKTQLEVEKMQNEQVTYTEQLEKLEKKLKNTRNESDKVRLTLEINTLKTTMMENDYNLKSKDKEIANLQEMLANIDILAPVDGTIRKVDEEGQTGSFITIQQSGAYRVQGMLNEMSMNGGVTVGTRVKIFSRISDQIWMGTVTAINTQDASQNNGDMWNNYGVIDTMTTSSSYCFDVELDSVEGLLLGQHVYMEIYIEQQPMEGVWIPESFIFDMMMDEETFEMTGQVWAEGAGGKLEQRVVTLGMYDYMTGCYEILTGLSEEDYLADPANPGCKAGASVSRRVPEDFTGGAATGPVEEMTEGAEPEYEFEIPEQTYNADVLGEEDGSYDTMHPIETQPEGTEAAG